MKTCLCLCGWRFPTVCFQLLPVRFLNDKVSKFSKSSEGRIRIRVSKTRLTPWCLITLVPKLKSKNRNAIKNDLVKVSKAFNINHCAAGYAWTRGPSDYEKSFLTSRPERCAVSHKSGNDICRYITLPNPSTVYCVEGFPNGLEPRPP